MNARCMRVSMLVALVLASWPNRSNARFVIAPGYEKLFLQMGQLQAGTGLGWRIEGVRLERDAAIFSFRNGDRVVTMRLVHPTQVTASLVATKSFAVVADRADQVPAELVQALVERIRALEGRFEWVVETPRATGTASDSSYAPTLPDEVVSFDRSPLRFDALPEAADRSYRNARDLLTNGKWKEAAAEARRLARSWPDSEPVLRAAASILRAAGEGQAAVDLLKRVYDLQPDGPSREAVLEMAASRVAARNAEEAVRALTGATGFTEPLECRQAEVASILAREGRRDLARGFAPPARRDGPRCLTVVQARIAHADDEDARLDALMDEALARNPDDDNLLYFWGYHYYAKRRMDQAVRIWERLVPRNPTYPAVLGQYGTAWLVAGRLDRRGTEEVAQRAAANPDDIVSSFLAGLGSYYLKEYDRVVPFLEPVVRAVPHESRARLYLAMAHYFLGHQETAERMFEEMEPYAYQDPDIYYCRSLIYRKRDLPRAIREMERFLEVFVGENRLSFGPEKVEKARSDLERMRRGEVPELNLPGDPLVPAK